MCRSTASTTTIASSTTSPIASTRPNKESVLTLKPNSGKNMKVPTSDTGTASSGISVDRQPCRNMKTTSHHQGDGNQERLDDFLDSLVHRPRGIHRDGVVDVVGKALLGLGEQLSNAGGGIHGVGSRQLIHRDNRARFAVQLPGHAIVLRAQFHSGHVAARARCRCRGFRAPRFARTPPAWSDGLARAQRK